MNKPFFTVYLNTGGSETSLQTIMSVCQLVCLNFHKVPIPAPLSEHLLIQIYAYRSDGPGCQKAETKLCQGKKN